MLSRLYLIYIELVVFAVSAHNCGNFSELKSGRLRQATKLGILVTASSRDHTVGHNGFPCRGKYVGT